MGSGGGLDQSDRTEGGKMKLDSEYILKVNKITKTQDYE